MPDSVPGPPSPPRLAGRRTVAAAIAVVVLLAIFYGVLPQIPELARTLERLRAGDLAWLGAAAVFELLSFAGYVVVFRMVFAGPGSRIDLRAAYQVTMAGVVATRVLATGGAGGIALTAWALAHAGFDGTAVRRRLAAFLVLLYSVFLVALLVAALGLRAGLFPGPAPFGLTVVPAVFAAAAIGAALALALVPDDLEKQVDGGGAGARTARIAAAVPATVSAGVRGAIALLRTRRPGLLGAPAWWACDIAVLWACLHAFDAAPPMAVVVVAYFVGMIGNLLPLPGGVGGVEGGMVGALLGFGVAGGPAILAVLAYRAFAFWLPIVPGIVAYLGLLRTVHEWDTEPQADHGEDLRTFPRVSGSGHGRRPGAAHRP